MNNGPNTNRANQPGGWEKLDENIKLIGLAGLGISAVLIMTAFGPQALYLLIATVALGTFVIYPEIEPERVLWGAVIGAIFAGPLGIIIGAGLGHYLGKKYDTFMRWVDPIFTAFTVTTTPLLRGASHTAAATASVLGKAKELTTNITSTVSKAANLIQNARTTLSDAFNTTDDVENAKNACEPSNAQKEQTTEDPRKDIFEQPKPLQFSKPSIQSTAQEVNTTSQQDKVVPKIWQPITLL